MTNKIFEEGREKYYPSSPYLLLMLFCTMNYETRDIDIFVTTKPHMEYRWQNWDACRWNENIKCHLKLTLIFNFPWIIANSHNFQWEWHDSTLNVMVFSPFIVFKQNSINITVRLWMELIYLNGWVKMFRKQNLQKMHENKKNLEHLLTFLRFEWLLLRSYEFKFMCDQIQNSAYHRKAFYSDIWSIF